MVHFCFLVHLVLELLQVFQAVFFELSDLPFKAQLQCAHHLVHFLAVVGLFLEFFDFLIESFNVLFHRRLSGLERSESEGLSVADALENAVS